MQDQTEREGEILKEAIRSHLITEEDTSVVLYDLEFLKQRLREIRSLFPSGSLHTVAVKANPLPTVLELAQKEGFGAEVASWPELAIARRAAFPPRSVVFDSPVKTARELQLALSLGVHVNADSVSELERIDAVLANNHLRGIVGIRLNPQVGQGAIAATSVAGRYSKFGVPLKEEQEHLLETFRRFRWLSAVHVHLGSQGCSLPLLLDGVHAVTQFAADTNAKLGENRIGVVDIGGGLPVTYRADTPAPALQDYVEGLKARCPELFGGGFRIVTEFGRYIHAQSGWAAARVEYVKHAVSGNTILVHLGADMFLRRCYNPAEWYHRLTLVDGEGNAKSGPDISYNVGGPLCFGGDMLARETMLPRAEPGDYLIIHDAGAYTLSMWSRYNSRQTPKVLGYEKGSPFRVLKERETLEDVVRFWEPRTPSV